MKFEKATKSILPLLLLTACGGGGGGDSASATSTTSSTGFPVAISVASPLGSTSSTTSVAGVDMWQKIPIFKKIQIAWNLARQHKWNALANLSPTNPFISNAHAATSVVTEHGAFLTILGDIFSGRLALSSALNASYLLEAQGGNANCYGPSLNYSNHPDGALPNTGQLPGGDLGIWQDNVNNDSTDTACSAAQLNLKMRAAKRSVHTALLLLAGMRYQAFLSGVTPAAGASTNLLTVMNGLGISNVSFTTATLARSADGATWTYTLALNVTVTGPSAGTYPVTLTLSNTHVSTTNYSGILQFTAENTINAGNCMTFSTTATNVSTVKYSHTSTSATVGQRAGVFCGNTANLPSDTYNSDGQLNPSAKFTNGTNKGWADNFSRFAASFDPSTLDGSFAYAWQAGKDDGHVRAFNVWTQTASGVRTGEAYFGFGDDIATTNGSIKGMICNWAGPGNNHNYTEYSQRQSLAYNDTSGKWTIGSAGSDIRYAPTVSCQYTDAQHTGGATFWYDRDLTGSTTANPAQANLIVDSTNVTYPFDLLGKGTEVDITTAITARGFTLPSNF